MLDREKQAKKQQDAEYEGAGDRANNQLKSYRLQYKALNHALASDIDCIYSRRLRQILRSTKKHRESFLDLRKAKQKVPYDSGFSESDESIAVLQFFGKRLYGEEPGQGDLIKGEHSGHKSLW